MSMLQKLAKTNFYTTLDLQRAYGEWIASDPDGRNDFQTQRGELVKQLAGCYYNQANELKTSGSSTGLVRTYRWGPCYYEFFLFHYRLCFEHVDHDGLVYVNFKEKGDFQRHRMIQYGDTRLLMLSTGREQALNIENALAEIRAEFAKPIIWFIPTQMEIMINRRHGLLDKLLSSYGTYHCTGEICPVMVKEFVASHGGRVLDTMRVWNGGASFYTCPHGGLHWNNMAAQISVIDGNLRTSDLWNCAQLFWDVATGDRLRIFDDGICPCGLVRQRNEWFGRDQVVHSPAGDVEYLALRNAFVSSLVEVSGRAEPEVLSNLLGVNFGVGKQTLQVNYEFKQDVSLDSISSHRLAEMTGLFVVYKRGLQYGTFKNRRLYRLDVDDEAVKIFM